MKKTVKMTFAALTAALMLGTAVAAPVYAAEEKSPVGYVLGDVDMNGAVEMEDALTVLQEYTNIILMKTGEQKMNEAQYALGHIITSYDECVSMEDALFILTYYVYKNFFENNTWETIAVSSQRAGVSYGKVFETMIEPVDRGAYKLVFDEKLGDYVLAEKG